MSKGQVVGLLLMCTALGLNAANFAPLVTDVASGVNYMLHFVPSVLVVAGAALAFSRRKAGLVLVHISIALYWAFAAFAIFWAVGHPNPNAFGPHNFNDYFPVVLFSAGAVLWLVKRHGSHFAEVA